MPPPAPTVADLLRGAIDDKGIAVRALARKLAGDDATQDQVEAWRRSLNKYLDGTVPSRPRALLIARALNLPDDYFVVARRTRRDVVLEIRDRLVALEERVGQIEARLPDQ